MKIITGGRDALRQEALAATLSAIIHDRPEDLERALEIDRRLARRGQLRLVHSAPMAHPTNPSQDAPAVVDGSE